ncbi:MAG: GNAT family N-acetyltransferase [Terrimicrobiaceae bacterium]
MIRIRPSLDRIERMLNLFWLRFHWDLKNAPADDLKASLPFVLSRADRDDKDAVQKVATNAFSMDTGWSDIQRIFAETIVRNVRAGFEKDSPDCVIVQHGSRIIGASILNTDVAAESHLTTGPCVLHEYRGRGLGTLLLKASLAALRDAGLPRAYGVARDRTAAARFLYPKFGGSCEPWSPDFEVAQKLAA